MTPRKPSDRVRFRDRDPLRIGIGGVVVLVLLVVLALQYQNLPLINNDAAHTAEFEDAAGLKTGDAVYVSGIKAGTVSDIRLAGDHVVVAFSVTRDVQLGSPTRARISTDSLLGKRALTVLPAGDGKLDGTIPRDRTDEPYALNEALGDLSKTAAAIDTNQVNAALDTMSTTLRQADPSLRPALEGITALSRAMNRRDEELGQLLQRAQSVTGVLSRRSEQMNQLMLDANTLLDSLDRRRAVIDELITNLSALSRQLSGVVRDNEAQLRPAMQRLNNVLEMLQANKTALTEGIEQMGPYATALSEAVSSGPFFYAYIQNLSLPHYTQDLSDLLVQALGGPAPTPRPDNPNMPRGPEVQLTPNKPEFGERGGRY